MKAEADNGNIDGLSNILIGGGSSLIPGLMERLANSLGNAFEEGKKMKLSGINERSTGVWCGGSIVGSLGSFQPFWINQNDYDECGPSIISRRCL